MFNDFYSGTNHFARMSYVKIILTPKKVGACTVIDFSSISLLNTIFKFITKVIANKLRPLYDHIYRSFVATKDHQLLLSPTLSLYLTSFKALTQSIRSYS